jgi:D-3-phosphoglycerate dehydrogenase
VSDLRAGRWNKKEYSKALGLKGRTLGIVGAGSIGTEVARRALALEMNVLFYNLGRSRRLVDFPHTQRVELDDLMRQSDVVSVHVPGGPGTRNLIDARRLALLKPTALLINTSRAGVIDEAALVEALRAKRIRGAATDVYENEPPADGTEIRSPLCELANLYGTHHIGASTEQAQLAIADATCELVATYKRSGQILNCVNMQNPTAAQMLVVRFVNKPGGLAHVFQNLVAEEINVEEMDHVIYDGGQAACAHIRISKAPSPALLERIRTGHANVIDVEVMQAI